MLRESVSELLRDETQHSINVLSNAAAYARLVLMDNHKLVGVLPTELSKGQVPKNLSRTSYKQSIVTKQKLKKRIIKEMQFSADELTVLDRWM